MDLTLGGKKKGLKSREQSGSMTVNRSVPVSDFETKQREMKVDIAVKCVCR
jgi:hypothetical protein